MRVYFQVKRAQRCEKIRTYNFHQNRVTDHRLQVTMHDMEHFHSGQLLDNLHQKFRLHDAIEKIKQTLQFHAVS